MRDYDAKAEMRDQIEDCGRSISQVITINALVNIIMIQLFFNKALGMATVCLRTLPAIQHMIPLICSMYQWFTLAL